MRIVNAKYARESVCSCGFRVLNDGIPLGVEYQVDLDDTDTCVWQCGGCKKEQRLEAIFVLSRAGGHGGYLPKMVFEIPQLNLSHADHPDKRGIRRTRKPRRNG